jgi:diguanylate cyclase (GGDEF)-like protein
VPARKNIFHHLLDTLEKQPAGLMLLTSFLLAMLLGVLDFWTGFEISFSFFYLIPVSLAAWTAGRRGGVLVSIESAAIWLIANRLSGQDFSNLLIPFWNAIMRMGIFIFVTFLLAELRRLLNTEKKLARTDFLTGVLNSRAFYDTANKEIQRAQRHLSPFTLVYIDLDCFKAINDQFGHSVGDKLLRVIADNLTRNTRNLDAVARIGGDEFALLLPQTSQKAAQSLLTRLQGLVLDEMQQNQWAVTLSISAITFVKPPESVDEILRSADQLMYDVKRNGKNAIAYASSA